MNSEKIREKVVVMANKYGNVNVIDFKRPLMMHPYRLDARELTMIFLEIEGEYEIDLDILFSRSIDFSVDSIVNGVVEQLRLL